MGTAGGAASIEGFDFETSTAVVGLSVTTSACSLEASEGRLSVDLNFDERVLAEIDVLPRDLGGAAGSDDGGGMFSDSSSSAGEDPKRGVMILPDDGNRGLCPNEPEPLGFVRCERKETDLLTLCPKSDTLEVRLNILLSLLWPLTGCLLSLSGNVSSGGLNPPFALSSVTSADSFAFVCLFPVNLPNTLVDVVEKDGILTARCGQYA